MGRVGGFKIVFYFVQTHTHNCSNTNVLKHTMFPRGKKEKKCMASIRDPPFPTPFLFPYPFHFSFPFFSHLIPPLFSSPSVPQYQAKTAVFVLKATELLVPGSLAVLWPTSALTASLLGTRRHESAGESYMLPVTDKARPK